MSNKDMVKKYATSYEERVVAFVDILGFSAMVDNSSSNGEEYERIKSALETIQNVKNISDINDAKVTTFSDSIIISYPAKARDPLFYILIDLIHLQLNLLQQGILVRGGIAKGKVRHVKEMVFGPAMISAYELESKYAVYPRIIVEKELVDWEQENYRKQKYSAEYDIEDLMSLLKKDDYNDIYYIDILRQKQELNYLEDYELLLCNVRETIIKGLKNRNKSIVMKYIWLKNYYNEIITSYPKLVNELLINWEYGQIHRINKHKSIYHYTSLDVLKCTERSRYWKIHP